MAQNPLKTDDFDVPKDKTLADLSPADLKKAFENASTVETVKFTYAGNNYAVDLHEQHREEFYEVMRKYVDAGRPDTQEQETSTSRNGGSGGSAVKNPDVADARWWARETDEGKKKMQELGLTVAKRASLKGQVMEAWKKADSPRRPKA